MGNDNRWLAEQDENEARARAATRMRDLEVTLERLVSAAQAMMSAHALTNEHDRRNAMGRAVVAASVRVNDARELLGIK